MLPATIPIVTACSLNLATRTIVFSLDMANILGLTP